MDITEGTGDVHPFPIRRLLNRYRRTTFAAIVVALGCAAGIVAIALDDGGSSTCATIESTAVRVIAVEPATTSCPNAPHLTASDGGDVRVYACDLSAPRQIVPVVLPDVGHVLFVGTRRWRSNSSLYALVDRDQDGTVDTKVTLDDGLDQPSGVEWVDGVLYVATARRLLSYHGVEDALRQRATATRRDVLAELPFLPSLQWHYLRANRRGDLYVSFSAGCDHCVPNVAIGATVAMLERARCYEPRAVVRGVRFSVGFDFVPNDEDRVVLTNNGHDTVGDEEPWDTIQIATPGDDFGFPFCYTGANNTLHPTRNPDVPPTTNYAPHACDEYRSGIAMGQQIAPLGLSFLDDTTVLVAERGSFTPPYRGHRVSALTFANGTLTRYRAHVTGFLAGPVRGRPVDVRHDGTTVFVSDDGNGVVYAMPRGTA